MTEQTHQQEPLISISVNPKLIHGRFAISVPMALGILLFFLPFFNVKCNGLKLVSASGYHTAVGLEVKPEKDLDFMKGFGERHDLGTRSSNRSFKSDKQDPNYFLLAIMIIGTACAIIAATKLGKRLEISFWGALICSCLFVVVQFQVITFTNRPEFSSELIDLSVQCTFWFYLSFLLFALAIYIAYKQVLKYKLEERNAYIEQWKQENGYGQTAVEVPIAPNSTEP